MANLNIAIRGLQIRDAFFGDGLKRNAGDGDIAELDLKTSGGLKIDTAQLAVEPADFAGAGLVDDGSDNLAVNVDDVGLEVASGNIVAIKDGGVPEVKLDVNTASGVGVDGFVLYWNNSAGKLDYKDVDVGFIADGDFCKEDMAYNDTTLTDTPVANSLHLYLNGLLQEEGSGKDYQISGTTITWATAPELGDILIAYYIKS
jgi:hypothetical protein